MNIKESGELSGIIAALRRMAMFEMTLAELYSLCASTWEEDREFWLDIWKDEIKHAQYVSRIIEIVSKKPEGFEKGRPFNVFTVETTVSDIRNKIEMTKKGDFPKNNLLFIARDLENGYLEERYGEIVSTDNIEYNSLMQRAVTDTREHKDKIVQKIKETTVQKGSR
jgi:hypothetical protein